MTDTGSLHGDAPEAVVVRCGRLIDGTGRPPQERVDVVISAGTIHRVCPVGAAGENGAAGSASVVDALGATVLPGLMDLHVHLSSVVDPDEPNTSLAFLSASSPLLTLHAARNARRMVEAGFTTVRDLAGYNVFSGAEISALRRGIEIGLVPGPRVFAAGIVSATASHPDMGAPLTWPRAEGIRADGPWEVRRQVRERVRGGVDLIKTFASGAGSGHGEELWWRIYTHEEMLALVDESHSLGRRVAAHSHTAAGAKRALLAGVDTIEHGTELDEEAIALFCRQGAFLIPTLSVRSPRALAGRRAGGSTPETERKFQRLVAAGLEGVNRAHRAGVRIACGTDTYRSLRKHWGDNAYELELLVQAGLSPMEAIVAATRTSAEALGQQERLGSLEPGKLADLLVVDGDPLADIRLLQDKARIRLVMKEGRIVVDRRGSPSS